MRGRRRCGWTPGAEMPERATVEQFVALVEAGDGLQAMERFYADDVAVQENLDPPRLGKAALMRQEAAAQAAVVDRSARCVRPLLVDGDTVVLRWVFTYRSPGGPIHRLEELVYQTWAGEQLVHEQFFYDPAQLRGG